MISLGIDIGSSSVKVEVYNHHLGKSIASAYSPSNEMEILSEKQGWAEQDPESWWKEFLNAFDKAINSKDFDPSDIMSIGISYQMHGLVCLDKHLNLLRPSIIWCDGRATETGNKIAKELSGKYISNNLLNSPGNFTASKLGWVKNNEPDVYSKIAKICLPGDYIAYKLTGKLTTTHSGLSEGIFYDFEENALSQVILDSFGFTKDIIPEIKNTFDDHGKITDSIAQRLGLNKNVKVSYKSGDQPNNAFSLNVLKEGEAAATAGTSGVIYAVTKERFFDPDQRLNSFAHVNHTKQKPSIGALLCINGVGISNAWIKRITASSSYQEMNDAAENIKPGSEDLMFFPFGNGPERIFNNKNIGAHFQNLNFNIHSQAHLFRSVQEGIAFSFIYGLEILHENDFSIQKLKVGYANLFLSPLFRNIISSIAGVDIHLYDTNGAIGAALGSLVGNKSKQIEEVFNSLKIIETIKPDKELQISYREVYKNWKLELIDLINKK